MQGVFELLAIGCKIKLNFRYGVAIMRKILITLICLSFFLVGCRTTSETSTPRAIGTTIDLSRKNYRTLKAGAQGRDGGFYLFGIIPLARVSEGDAMVDLYSKIDVEGKATTLINVHKDKAMRYYVLFSLPYTQITADVIEFIDEDNKDPRP
jgi:hypothetical protein